MKYLILITAMIMAVTHAHAQDTMAKPQTAIVDKASVLTADQEASIQQIISHLDQTRSTKAYLIIMDSLPSGQNILAFTKGIFKKWELNDNGIGLGFVMVYSKKDKAVRVEASDATLKILTREYIQEVIAKSIFPFFKQRKEFEGLKRGMEMLANKIENN